MGREQADVDLAWRTLKREVVQRRTYTEAAKTWQCRSELQQRVQLVQRDAKNNEFMRKAV